MLFDASMKIRCSKSAGIVGPSAAGKTTSVNIILGLLNPQRGQVLVDGVDVKTFCPPGCPKLVISLK